MNVGEFGETYVPPRASMTRVNIREMCFDGELRLRDGFDENQGRVEICFGGVWGTICSDGPGWAEGGLMNAAVVCQQLGLVPSSQQGMRYSCSYSCRCLIKKAVIT